MLLAAKGCAPVLLLVISVRGFSAVDCDAVEGRPPKSAETSSCDASVDVSSFGRLGARSSSSLSIEMGTDGSVPGALEAGSGSPVAAGVVSSLDDRSDAELSSGPRLALGVGVVVAAAAAAAAAAVQSSGIVEIMLYRSNCSSGVSIPTTGSVPDGNDTAGSVSVVPACSSKRSSRTWAHNSWSRSADTFWI
ncbi:hypothetical protein Malapachy_1064 [Malassezia pachydermatis]|uniref:Secreted protein n=1 Tax=Malassezia pachydermatis TaxID=77020 RepID=A0A0M8MLJ8_9BASI|nr:hypothetical protein Malapachy_1064 [Malassezia pachydermatis]KOS14936.1 hypothetical protein Malapachy_1064 [Malassezia pachydermatis]